MADNIKSLDDWKREESKDSLSLELEKRPKCRYKNCTGKMIMIKQTAFSFPLRSSKIGEVIKDADAYAIDLHFACTEHGYTTVHGVPISATSFKFIADGVLLNGNNRKKAN